MGHRWRLAVVAVITTGLTASVAAVVAVITVTLREQLQQRYDDAGADVPESARQVATEYVTPALWSVVLVAVMLFLVGTVVVRRSTPPEHRAALSRDLALTGALPLLLQVPYGVWAVARGVDPPRAASVSGALALAGVLVLLTRRGRSWLHVVVCVLAGSATLAVWVWATLAAPAVVAVGSLLLAAGVTTAADRRGRGTRSRETMSGPRRRAATGRSGAAAHDR